MRASLLSLAGWSWSLGPLTPLLPSPPRPLRGQGGSARLWMQEQGPARALGKPLGIRRGLVRREVLEAPVPALPRSCSDEPSAPRSWSPHMSLGWPPCCVPPTHTG